MKGIGGVDYKRNGLNDRAARCALNYGKVTFEKILVFGRWKSWEVGLPATVGIALPPGGPATEHEQQKGENQ